MTFVIRADDSNFKRRGVTNYWFVGGFHFQNRLSQAFWEANDCSLDRVASTRSQRQRFGHEPRASKPNQILQTIIDRKEFER